MINNISDFCVKKRVNDSLVILLQFDYDKMLVRYKKVITKKIGYNMYVVTKQKISERWQKLQYNRQFATFIKVDRQTHYLHEFKRI